MKKIPSVFQRNYDTDGLIRNEVVPGCEWVLAGEGIATLKFDGSCCAIMDGVLYKRYDAKHGKTPPVGFIPAQDPDPVTGHWPGWVRADKSNPADKWFFAARSVTEVAVQPELEDGTYEAIGPHFQGNAEKLVADMLVKHGVIVLDHVSISTRTYDGLRDYLENNYIEGIVFHRGNGDMAKVKRVDFGFEWNGKTTKRQPANIGETKGSEA